MTTFRRIALLTLAVPWQNRPANGLYNIAQARALRDLGVETEIFTVAPRLPRVMKHLGGPWARQIARPDRYEQDGVPINTLRCPIAYPRSVRTHAAPRVPQMICQAFHAATLHAFTKALNRFRPDALIVHGMLPWTTAADHHTRELGIPAIVIEHSADDVDAASRHPGQRRFILQNAMRFTAIASVNARLTDMLQRLGATHAITLTNGIAQRPHIVNAHNRHGLSILTAGQFIKRKGHRDLFAAFVKAGIPQSRLRIVGTPPPPLLRQIKRDLPSGAVEVLPTLNNEQLMGEMAKADLFALPSWSESFGLVFAEALSVGTPILATTDSGIADHIKSGSHGWLVPPHDVNAIAQCLKNAAGMTQDERRHMGLLSRQLALERFNWTQNAASVLRALCSPASDTAQLQFMHHKDRLQAPITRS